MKKRAKNVFAKPNPDGSGHQISYELGNSRRVHQFCKTVPAAEKSPHGAGSFHDPEQHRNLMERVEDYINSSR